MPTAKLDDRRVRLSPARGRPARRWATIAGVSWRAELGQRSRPVNTAIRLTMQLFVVACFWRGFYQASGGAQSAAATQTVSYAVLAVLVTQTGGIDRMFSRDSIVQHLQRGTILYWLVRPIPPRRYYLMRAIGDRAYGLAWGTLGYVVCLQIGVVAVPAGPAAAVVGFGSFVLGCVTLVYLNQVLDLVCFWTMLNTNALNIYQFVMNLMSGAIAPLWFFPDWFRAISAVLPFQNILNTPLSVYVGRIPVRAAVPLIGIQLLWILLLVLLTRLMWRRAASSTAIEGG
ncbi:ABC-2 family transporter protein [Actinoplanes sp. NPDC026670]|uniref:ABC-2 family transporter protein n=1 Tax=Actinoplanes sp. NPDC026670 TaxID=3154700 RepID=UPI0033D32B05